MAPVIPMRRTRKLRVAVDRTLYRLRNLVERCFNRLKNARRVATRRGKTAESFLGLIDITSIRLWLRHLLTWPTPRIAHRDASFARPVQIPVDGSRSCPLCFPMTAFGWGTDF